MASRLFTASLRNQAVHHACPPYSFIFSRPVGKSHARYARPEKSALFASDGVKTRYCESHLRAKLESGSMLATGCQRRIFGRKAKAYAKNDFQNANLAEKLLLSILERNAREGVVNRR